MSHESNRADMRMGRVALFALGAALLLAACSKKAPEELPPAPEGSNYGDGSGTGGYGDGSGQGAGAGRVVPGSKEDFLAQVSADRIYFDTDMFNVDADDQSVLQSQAQWLRQYPAVTVVIEGHADERGTRDYNLALGERRANAAKNYLASLGIGAERIRTISYGKERPEALGSDAESWARNRRAVTVTVAPR